MNGTEGLHTIKQDDIRVLSAHARRRIAVCSQQSAYAGEGMEDLLGALDGDPCPSSPLYAFYTRPRPGLSDDTCARPRVIANRHEQ